MSLPNRKKKNNSRPGGAFHYGPVLTGWMVFLAGTAPLLFHNALGDLANLPKQAFLQTGAIALVCLWAAQMCLRRRMPLVFSPLHPPVLALLGWALLSLAWAENPAKGWTCWHYWAGCAAVYFVLSSLPFDARALRLMLGAAAAAGAALAFLGAAQYWLDVTAIRQFAPPSATFGNKNMAAQFTAFVLPAGTALFFTARNRAGTILAAAGMTAVAVYLLYTRARAAWLGAAIALAVLALVLAREKHRSEEALPPSFRRRCLGLALLAFLLLAPWAPPGKKKPAERLAESVDQIRLASLDPESRETSITARLAIWRNTWEMIQDHFWLGVGLHNWDIAYPPYAQKAARRAGTRSTYRAHNDYLQTWAELGTAGMFLLSWLGVSWAVSLKRAWAGLPRREDRLLLAGANLGVLAAAADAFFSFPYQLAVLPFYTAAAAGVTAAAGTRDPPLHIPAPRWMSAALLLFSAAWLVVSARTQWRLLRADACSLKAMGAISTEDFDRAVQWNSKALYYHSGHWKARFNRALAHARNAQYAKAERDFRIFLDNHPHNREAWGNMAAVHTLKKEYERAAACHEKQLDMDPRSFQALYGYGMVLGMLERHQEAFQAFRQAAQVRPENADVYCYQGIAAASLENYAMARRLFLKALSLEPAHEKARQALQTTRNRLRSRRQ